MKHLIEKDKTFIWQTYKRNELVLTKGKGQYVWDINGKKYLDFLAGISVTILGHCNPRVIAAITKQVKLLGHTSNLYYTKPSTALAELLINNTVKKGYVFFSNSGAEANECAIKAVRRYGASTGNKKRYEIITFENSFHGRTIATISATGQAKFRKNFGPMVAGFKYAKFNDIVSVKRLVNKKTVAVMIEAVQGEGGVHIADPKFMSALVKLCKSHKILMIFDEVQCGLGRTGKFCGYQNYHGVKPDIITFAKGLANGLPIGATVVVPEVAKYMSYGDHGSTFGANPIISAAAVEVVKQLTPSVLSKVVALGKYFKDKLNTLKFKYEGIKEIRGIGLMIGIDLKEPGGDVVKQCQKNGLLINCTHNTVARFLPSYFITKTDIDRAVKIVDTALDTVLKK